MKTIPFPKEAQTIADSYGLPSSVFQAVRFEPHEFLFRQGYPCQTLYFIVSGDAAFQNYADDGSFLSYGRLSASNTVGEMELLCGETNATTTVEALSPLYCLSLSFQQANQLLETTPRFSLKLARYAAQGWRYMKENYAINRNKSAIKRLAGFLLQYQVNGWFEMPLTELSAALSVSYRHLQRMMADLCDKGLLRKEKRRYQLVDRTALIHLNDDLFSRYSLSEIDE